MLFFIKMTLGLALLLSSSLYAQTNIIRNSSFEKPSTRKHPNSNSDLDNYCRKWKKIQNPTSDWFRDDGTYWHGAVDCDLGGATNDSHSSSTIQISNSTNLNAPLVPAHSGHGYAGTRHWDGFIGEGIQQRIRQKLDFGIYELAFWYYVPCDTKSFAFEVYLGEHKNDVDLLVVSDTLPTDSILVWREYKAQFSVPLDRDRDFDWFLFTNTGDPHSNQSTSDGAYFYIDDFSLLVSDCDNCQAHGLISHNHNIPNVFSPDGDGIYDTLWIENINNVSYYEIEVFTRWGTSVYKEEGYNPNGFENHSIFWDGIKQNGQYFSYDQAWITLHLENCGSSYDYLHSVSLCNNAPPCNSYDWDTVPNYVPPLFGLEAPPTHYRTLDLYGGPYYGNHHWYACDTIRIGGAGSHITPYFYAAATSTLKFSASEMVEIVLGDDVTIELGADIELTVEPVACCAALRRGDFSADSTEVTEMVKGDSESIEKPIEGIQQELKPLTNHENRLSVSPNPVSQVCNIRVELAKAEKVNIQLFNAQMHLVKTHFKNEWFELGVTGFKVDYSTLAKGVYFLRLESDLILLTEKIVIQ